MGIARLAISDGTTEISLLDLKKIHLREDDGWTPRIIQAKGGGVFQDSSMAESRRLVYRQFGTAREQFNLEIMGLSQDGLIANTADLLQMLEKAVNYFDTDWQHTPVYLIAQSDCETYARYALILDYSAPELQNPYAQPFIQQDGAIFDDITIGIERGHWSAEIPGNGTAIEISAQQDYNSDTYGRAATTANEVYVANKRNEANITHVKVYDAAPPGYTTHTPPAALPYFLFTAAPAVGDICYFGIDTTLADSGPFASIVFDLTAITLTATFAWEYWNGAWVALTVQDGTGGFQNSGVVSTHWEQPSDWVTVAVDGITAYWVRARITAYTAGVPVQQNRDIYSVVTSFVNAVDTEVVGDIPALAKIDTNVRSSTAGGDLWVNRVIIGLRQTSRGALFTPYLNISNEQNPSGIVVTNLTNTSFVADTTTPTGVRATYNPLGAEAMASRIRIAIAGAAEGDFNGIFHAFLRCAQSGGTAGDIEVRLAVSNSYGQVYFYTPIRALPDVVNDFHLLDFGEIKIPASEVIKDTETFTPQILVQASSTGGVPNLYLYDLILIPVDEWAGDFIDVANSGNTLLFLDRILHSDSIDMPKFGIRAVVERNVPDEITTVWQPVINGPVILQANAEQRLYWLMAVTSATGSSFVWLAEPYLAATIQAYKSQRYLGLRGNA